MEQPAEVDVVAAGAQRALHHLEVQPVVHAVDADRRICQRAFERSGVARVDVLVSFQRKSRAAAGTSHASRNSSTFRPIVPAAPITAITVADCLRFWLALQMTVEQRAESERLADLRERYVARGLATPPLYVARAEGARIVDVDGREYIDFAGGLACQNLGHGFPPAVAAIHEQVDRYLHQCAMVGMYEPYVEVCRRLAELSPCGRASSAACW